jgi:hypothetical protein
MFFYHYVIPRKLKFCETRLFQYLCLDYCSVKRLFAIVILNIFLLNVLGHYGILLGLKAESATEVSSRLNSDMYDLGGTVTFKVPLAVPYSTDSEGYEKVRGEFKKDGEIYRLVKQRLYQDTLYIVCIKDEATSKIDQSLEDFVQSFAGHADDSQQQVASPDFIKDYVDATITLTNSVNGWEKEVANASVPQYFLGSYHASIVHPPDNLLA